MLRPRIGFTSREQDSSYFHKWQHDYWFCIVMAGGEPIRLHPEAVENSDAILDQLDGLMLTGGGDIDPSQYNQTLNGAERHSIYPERDRMELALTRAAVNQGMPIFGICRGIQVINVALGGSLTQHIDSHSGKVNSFEGPKPHTVSVRPRSLLDKILQNGATITVNSYHHQAIQAGDLAPALLATAIAPDGVIEAVEHPVHPWCLGVQWHPERLYELSAEHRHLFEAFVAAAQRYHTQNL